MQPPMIGAIEAGGTKFRAAIFDADATSIVAQTRVPTTSPDETLDQIIAFFAAQPQVAAIGIASFGPLVVDRSSSKYGSFGSTPKPGWTDAPMLTQLSAALEVPIDIQTDVEAAAVAEHAQGAGRGHSSIGYVTVGTGVGAALAENGVPYRGRNHTELGHIAVKRVAGDGYEGHCPFHGDCLEGMASGPAIAARWNADPSTLGDRSEVWDLEAAYLAQLVRTFAYTFAPDIVLFGGGVGAQHRMAARIQAAVTADLAGYATTDDLMGARVATAGLGEDAGLVGAALLAKTLTPQ